MAVQNNYIIGLNLFYGRFTQYIVGTDWNLTGTEPVVLVLVLQNSARTGPNRTAAALLHSKLYHKLQANGNKG